MAYADFVPLADFRSAHAGASIGIAIFDEDSPGAPLIGNVTGINSTDDFESIPIEEAGNEGVKEIAQGRHTISMTIQAFWTPERNDALPTRLNFIGRKYTIQEFIAPGRPGAGEVVNTYLGCVLSRNGQAHGARGAKTIDLAFQAEQRLNGQQWADVAPV